jgi:hypothetical protein
LMSPRTGKLNMEYQGATAARPCASVRPWADAVDAPVSNAAANASWNRFFMMFFRVFG